MPTSTRSRWTPAGSSPIWSCSATITPTPGRGPSGCGVRGSTDTFSFADEPDRAKGTWYSTPNPGSAGTCPLAGRLPAAVTLGVHLRLGGFRRRRTGRSRLLQRARHRPGRRCGAPLPGKRGPWRSTASLDMHAVREAARAGLHLKVEPQFAVDVHARGAADDATNLGGQWEGYLERPRPHRSGPGPSTATRPRLYRASPSSAGRAGRVIALYLTLPLPPDFPGLRGRTRPEIPAPGSSVFSGRTGSRSRRCSKPSS